MSRRLIVVAGIVVVFGLFMFSSLMRSCSPHVGFEQARSGERVQVFGTIVPEEIIFDSASLSLSFALRDEAGNILPVVYRGVVPSNFEYARQATCTGAWQDGKFEAEQLLLKCPSKYEGQVDDKGQFQFYDEDDPT